MQLYSYAVGSLIGHGIVKNAVRRELRAQSAPAPLSLGSSRFDSRFTDHRPPQPMTAAEARRDREATIAGHIISGGLILFCVVAILMSWCS